MSKSASGEDDPLPGRGVLSVEPKLGTTCPRPTRCLHAHDLTQGEPVPLTSELAAGARIGEQYRVERFLGAGGMGVVYLARDERLMRDVALKFVQPKWLSALDGSAHLMAEARAMARVKHRNVVDVYAFGTHRDVPYFVMEYVAGRTAEDWFVTRAHELSGFIPVDEVLGVIEQCCLGVAAIHESGAVHGDLKPTNLLLGKDYRVVVADFGVAISLGETVICPGGGTPGYMAPETLQRVVDLNLVQRRDVFSVAVMTYEFLVGRLPFASSDSYERPIPPSHLRADLPVAFDDVILSALETEPSRRTESVLEFWHQLAAARRSASQRPGSIRMLLVDDDDSFSEFVEHALLDAFPTAEFARCATGRDALQKLLGQAVDVLLVDLRLPDINGVELTAEVRTHYPAWRLPIVVVTAWGTAADWRLLSELGADAFLVKPFDIKSLTSCVGRLLEPTRTMPAL